MLVEVKVPALSESVAEATLLSWHKREGEQVDRGENLIDIETDKVVLELPAPAAGMLAKIIKDDGTTVTSGEIIATIDTEAAGASTTASTTATTAAAAETGAGATLPSGQPAPAPSPVTSEVPPMMPAARNMAAQANLAPGEIGSIKGSGRGGRITKEDVAEHVDRKAAAPSVPTSSEPAPKPTPEPMPAPTLVTPQAAAPTEIEGDRPEQRVPMSRLRARIAERLVQSQSTAAILTTFNEVNMQAIMDLRARHKDKFEKEHGVKLGIMSFFVKAVVAALKKFPIVNASVNGNDIIYHGYYDIGIAVSSSRGLVVPILRNADVLVAGADRKADRRFRQTRPGRETDHRGIDRWYILHYKWRRFRLHALHPDHQSPAKRDPRHSRHQGTSRGGEWAGGHPSDLLPCAILRSPHHRWTGSGTFTGGDERST